MNKLKRAVQELRSYLGRDTRGLKLLDGVSKIVNDQRKQVATLKESLSAAERAANNRTKELVDERAKNEKLETALQAETQRRVGAERREAASESAIRRLNEEMEAAADFRMGAEEGYGDSTQSEADLLKVYKRLMRSVRRKMTKAPPLVSCKPFTINLESVVKRHTNAEYLLLGQMVALVSLVEHDDLKDAGLRVIAKRIPTTKDNEDLLCPFVRWINNRWLSDDGKPSGAYTIVNQPEEDGSEPDA